MTDTPITAVSLLPAGHIDKVTASPGNLFGMSSGQTSYPGWQIGDKLAYIEMLLEEQGLQDAFEIDTQETPDGRAYVRIEGENFMQELLEVENWPGKTEKFRRRDTGEVDRTREILGPER